MAWFSHEDFLGLSVSATGKSVSLIRRQLNVSPSPSLPPSLSLSLSLSPLPTVKSAEFPREKWGAVQRQSRLNTFTLFRSRLIAVIFGAALFFLLPSGAEMQQINNFSSSPEPDIMKFTSFECHIEIIKWLNLCNRLGLKWPNGRTKNKKTGCRSPNQVVSLHIHIYFHFALKYIAFY